MNAHPVIAALAVGPWLGCAHPPPSSASPPAEPAPTVCATDEIAWPSEELPPGVQVAWSPVDTPIPWAPLLSGEARAPWLDTRAGLLVVPRPGVDPGTPARWDVRSSNTGAAIQAFEVPDPSALPSQVAAWMAGHHLLDGSDEAPLRSIPVPKANSRKRRTDPETGWSVWSGPIELGDADIDPMFSVDIPQRCHWVIRVGDEAYSALADGRSIDWSLYHPTLWVGPQSRVAVFAAIYRGQLRAPDGNRLPGEHFGVAYRVLGGAQ